MSKSSFVFPFFPKKYITKINQDFLSLFFLSSLISIQFLLYWRYIEDFNSFFIDLIFFVALYYQIYCKQVRLNTTSSFAEKILGLTIILLSYFRAKYIFLIEASVFWSNFFPILILCGYILMVAGFKGFKQFRLEVLGLSVIVLLYKIFAVLNRLNIFSITVVSAKFTSFLLWYLGFDSQTQGTFVYVNGGTIDILEACTALPPLQVLLKFSLIIALFFPLSRKKKLLLVCLAVIISFVLSIIRLLIMALVVNDPVPFQYWHGVEGGNVFTGIGFFLFFGIILLKFPTNNLNLTKPPLRKDLLSPRHNLWFLISANVILISILLNFIFDLSPVAGANRIAQYNFPETIEISDWQLQKSDNKSLTSILRDDVTPISIEQLRTEQRGSDILLSERSYTYEKNENILNVNLRYIINTFASLESYYKAFQNLPSLKDSVGISTNNHNYLQFSHDNYNYLATCVNVDGKSSITQDQFISQYQSTYSNVSKLWDWLLGKTLIQDRRCLWIEVSAPKNSNLSPEDFKKALFSLVEYWKYNFPPLRG